MAAAAEYGDSSERRHARPGSRAHRRRGRRAGTLGRRRWVTAGAGAGTAMAPPPVSTPACAAADACATRARTRTRRISQQRGLARGTRRRRRRNRPRSSSPGAPHGANHAPPNHAHGFAAAIGTPYQQAHAAHAAQMRAHAAHSHGHSHGHGGGGCNGRATSAGAHRAERAERPSSAAPLAGGKPLIPVSMGQGQTPFGGPPAPIGNAPPPPRPSTVSGSRAQSDLHAATLHGTTAPAAAAAARGASVCAGCAGSTNGAPSSGLLTRNALTAPARSGAHAGGGAGSVGEGGARPDSAASVGGARSAHPHYPHYPQQQPPQQQPPAAGQQHGGGAAPTAAGALTHEGMSEQLEQLGLAPSAPRPKEEDEVVRQQLLALALRACKAGGTGVGEGIGMPVGLSELYKLGKAIGEGAFGFVRVAQQRLSRELIAVKTFEKVRLRDSSSRRRLENEIRVLQRIRHPHIVRLYEVFESPKRIHLCMEHVSHGTLHRHLTHHKRLPEQEVRRLVRQLVGALSYLHARSIAHRDIKLENVLDERCNVRLIDFGFAILSRGKLRVPCGSPAYTAPEILLAHEYDGQLADVWSLGVLVYVMLAGRFLPGLDARRALSQRAARLVRLAVGALARARVAAPSRARTRPAPALLDRERARPPVDGQARHRNEIHVEHVIVRCRHFHQGPDDPDGVALRDHRPVPCQRAPRPHHHHLPAAHAPSASRRGEATPGARRA